MLWCMFWTYASLKYSWHIRKQLEHMQPPCFLLDDLLHKKVLANALGCGQVTSAMEAYTKHVSNMNHLPWLHHALPSDVRFCSSFTCMTFPIWKCVHSAFQTCLNSSVGKRQIELARGKSSCWREAGDSEAFWRAQVYVASPEGEKKNGWIRAAKRKACGWNRMQVGEDTQGNTRGESVEPGGEEKTLAASTHLQRKPVHAVELSENSPWLLWGCLVLLD